MKLRIPHHSMHFVLLLSSCEHFLHSFFTDPAQKVDELRPDLNENGIHEQAEFKLTRGSCWHVLFAPDESCFAWISAPKKVILVPWNKTTNSV